VVSRNTVSLLPGLEAHPSGALWMPGSKTVLIADLHLGYSWAQRRRGELGPLADARAREKLFALATDLQPQIFVFLGDLVHAPRPCTPEREWIEEIITQLSGQADLVAVRGNHDRAFAKEFGHLKIKTVEVWSQPGLTAIHGDRLACAAIPEHSTLVLGHLHPCLGIRDASGASQKLPLFLLNEHCLVLPAFSPFARGYDVGSGLPAELRTCFRKAEIRAFAATQTRVVPLGPLRQAIERMLSSTPSTPGHFRRRVGR
jgi:putative SbcD/Mre11-related phosphoesterase